MTRDQIKIAVVALSLAGVAAVLLILPLFGHETDRVASAAAAPQAAPAAPPPRAGRTRPKKPVASLRAPASAGPSFAIIRLAAGAEVPVHSAAGGRLVTTLGDRTDFGSARTFSVVSTRGSWVSILAPELPDGSAGWVRFDAAKMTRYWTKYSLSADLSARALTLSYGKTPVARYVVTVGGPGSETPTGRFAITDGLSFDASPYYGCCAMVTTGHQTSLPPGWIGGDSIAIHGTPGPVGEAASHGCLRATDATMHALMARVPLGTPLFVHD